MHRRVRGLSVPLAATFVAIAVAACGSSSSGGGSGNAQSLLKQTFSGSHTVNSGNLSFSLTIEPSGSSKLSGPITLSFGGPFQSLGKGKLPKSNFNVSISALGHTGTLGILSTGTSGYVSLDGTSYQLPQATFQKLESSFSSVGSGSGSGPAREARDQPARLAHRPRGRRQREHRGHEHDPHPRGDRRSRTAARSEHVPREGLIGGRVRQPPAASRRRLRPRSPPRSAIRSSMCGPAAATRPCGNCRSG